VKLNLTGRQVKNLNLNLASRVNWHLRFQEMNKDEINIHVRKKPVEKLKMNKKKVV